MLNGNLSLHGVDAEKLARKVLHDALRARNIVLDEFRREDLLQDLVITAWELAQRYDANQDYALQRGRRPGFDGWASQYLRLRVVDWFRKTEGRTKWQFKGYTYERPRPVVVSLDWTIHTHNRDSIGATDEHSSNGSRGSRLDEVVGSRDLDPATCSDADLRGALERGDSAKAWEAADVGERPTRRAQSRAA